MSRRGALASMADAARVAPRAAAFAAFGARSVLAAPVRVDNPGCVSVGDDVVVHEEGWLNVVRTPGTRPPRLRLHDRVRLGRFAKVTCLESVVLEEDVLTADHVCIVDAAALPDGGRRTAPVRIRRGAFLGWRAVVMPGVTVGENACVGAGAVVRADVPPRSVVVGDPARVVRAWDEKAQAWRTVTGGG